jgi:hypothetical protein
METVDTYFLGEVTRDRMPGLSSSEDVPERLATTDNSTELANINENTIGTFVNNALLPNLGRCPLIINQRYMTSGRNGIILVPVIGSGQELQPFCS